MKKGLSPFLATKMYPGRSPHLSPQSSRCPLPCTSSGCASNILGFLGAPSTLHLHSSAVGSAFCLTWRAYWASLGLVTKNQGWDTSNNPTSTKTKQHFQMKGCILKSIGMRRVLSWAVGGMLVYLAMVLQNLVMIYQLFQCVFVLHWTSSGILDIPDFQSC